MNSEEAFKKQEKVIEYYRKKRPDLLKHGQRRPEIEVLKEIGIFNVPKNRQEGYIRLFPQDFIVEEKTLDNKIIRINNINLGEKVELPEDKKIRTLYAYLIKIGIPTNVALQRIAASLDFPLNKIGFSGLKDADAITAQLIALPRINLSIEEIKQRKVSNVLLSNFYYGSGTLLPGSLKENIFTITIRTKDQPDPKALFDQLSELKNTGFLNYFHVQRFGGLRLISHKLGKLILQKRHQLAIRYFLFKTNLSDIPLVEALRKKAEQSYPNWPAVKKIFEHLPYTFFNELRAVDYLIKDPRNYTGALIALREQTQLWAYAYASWLFNKYISSCPAESLKNKKIPLVLSDNPKDREIYAKYLKEDGIANFEESLRPFKWIQLKQRFIEAKIFPKDVQFKAQKNYVVISFALSKGAYATTFLANLYELYQGLPIPDWVFLEEIDPKKEMDMGNISELKEIFKDEFYSKLESQIS